MIAKYGEAAKRGLGQRPAYECADVPDHAYIDGYNTELAIATMKEMAGRGRKAILPRPRLQDAPPQLGCPEALLGSLRPREDQADRPK